MDDATYERFMAKVEVLPNGCWYFHGKKNANGYAYFWYAGKSRLVHRWIYQEMIGPVPDELQVEHKCHTLDLNCRAGRGCPHRACVNFLDAGHLEVLAAHENVMRSRGLAAYNAVKTHCDNGHELTPGNTYRYPNGERGCRTCRTEGWCRYRDRHHPDRKLPAALRTSCPQNHPYDETNTRINSAGKRVCITCYREQDKLRKRAARSPGAGSPQPEAVLLPASMQYHKTCKNNHEWTPENTLFAGSRRSCRACRDARDAAKQAPSGV